MTTILQGQVRPSALPGGFAVLLLATGFFLVLSILGHSLMTDITDFASWGMLAAFAVNGIPLLGVTLAMPDARAGWARLGLVRPESWLLTLALAAALALAITACFMFVVPPVVQYFGRAPDISHVLTIRGNLPGFLAALAVVWITAAVFEEMFFRGYLLNALAALAGEGPGARATGVLASAMLFGIGHAYQGLSGVVVTGLVGLILGIAYLAARCRLWPLIIAHGLVDSYQFWQIYQLPTG